MSHSDRSQTPKLKLRSVGIALGILLQLTAFVGCGGGSSQSSMMKEAMARRSRAKAEEETEEGPKSPPTISHAANPSPPDEPKSGDKSPPATPQQQPGDARPNTPTPVPRRPNGNDDDAPAGPRRPTGDDDDAPAKPNRPNGDDNRPTKAAINNDRSGNTTAVTLPEGNKSVIFSSNHDNLIQSWQTDYQFDSRQRRPVELAISADLSIVASAQPPMQVTISDLSSTRLKDEDDDDNDTNARSQLSPAIVDVWKVVSKQRIRSWNQFGTERTKLEGIRFAPDGQTVITFPDVGMFNWKTGKSSELTPNCRLRILRSRSDLAGVVVLGLDGEQQQQSNILRIFEADPLTSDPLAPFAQFGSRVSAVAVANISSRIAFAVRSRFGHRLFVANPRDLANTLEEIESQSGYRQPWFDRQSAVGIQWLAFSQNDQLLLTYTEYGNRKFRATAFKLNWNSGKHEKLGEKDFKEKPLFAGYGSEPMKFVGKTDLVVLQEKRRVIVQDLERGLEEVIKIDLPASQRGNIATDISQDGNWLAAGNDDGEVYLWELETGRPISLTASGRPAHDGPIVGIAFSPLNPATGTTEYMVTASESNTIRVWSLVDRLTRKAMSETEKRLKENDAWEDIQGEDIRAQKAMEKKKKDRSRDNN